MPSLQRLGLVRHRVRRNVESHKTAAARLDLDERTEGASKAGEDAAERASINEAPRSGKCQAAEVITAATCWAAVPRFARCASRYGSRSESSRLRWMTRSTASDVLEPIAIGVATPAS